MFTQADRDRLIDAMRANGVGVLKVTGPDDRLVMVLDAPAPAPSIVVAGPKHVMAKSPCIGRFIPRGIDDGLSPLNAQDTVRAGDTMGYIAQHQALAVVAAPDDGRLVSTAPDTDQVFGYGDVVFTLEVTT